MSANGSQAILDDLDWQLLAMLQDDARQSFTALGQAVGLSRPAVAERVRRLEDVGVITGYRAVVDPSRVGHQIIAFTRVRPTSLRDAALLCTALAAMPEAQECYRTTGDDCYIVKVAVQSVSHLDAVLTQIHAYGTSSTAIVLSTEVTQRPVTKPAAAREG
jgi:Lrp/AsnC family transcriptional regulator, leucine-responsive regulatory protein